MDFQQEARKLEQEIKGGHIEDASEALHQMSPADRKAVAEQIKKDQQERKSDGLPPLTFYDSGDLKSADTVMDEHTKIHTEYDKDSGRRKSEDYISDNNSSSHWEYNPQTRLSVSGHYKYENGTESHLEHDPKTNRNWEVDLDANKNVVETKGTDGKTRKFHYDENQQLDQIDGHLGHWDRTQDANGQTVWVNRDTNDKWQGDFTVDKNGDVHFSRSGSSWTFTRDGQDVRSSR
jgi:hypothetical protein